MENNSVYGECPKHMGHSMIACVLCELEKQAESKKDETPNANMLAEQYSDVDLLQADGFDEAILGVVFDNMNAVPRLAYSITKCVRILVDRDNMSPDEAREYFDFNVQGAYMGEQTPIWVEDESL